MTDDMTVVHQGNAAATIRTQTGKNPVEISSGNIVKFWITPGPKTAGLQLIIKVRETNQLPHTIPAHGHAIVAIRKGIKGVVSTPIGVGGH